MEVCPVQPLWTWSPQVLAGSPPERHLESLFSACPSGISSHYSMASQSSPQPSGPNVLTSLSYYHKDPKPGGLKGGNVLSCTWAAWKYKIHHEQGWSLLPPPPAAVAQQRLVVLRPMPAPRESAVSRLQAGVPHARQ